MPLAMVYLGWRWTSGTSIFKGGLGEDEGGEERVEDVAGCNQSKL